MDLISNVKGKNILGNYKEHVQTCRCNSKKFRQHIAYVKESFILTCIPISSF